jgi:hypothetical protein
VGRQAQGMGAKCPFLVREEGVAGQIAVQVCDERRCDYLDLCGGDGWRVRYTKVSLGKERSRSGR